MLIKVNHLARGIFQRLPENRLKLALRNCSKRLLESVHYQWFRMSEWMSGYKMERHYFSKTHGYPLDLKNPRSFNEKLCWRKIYDRNPLFPIIVDKIAVRKYVVERVGTERAVELLIPLFFETQNPATIPFQLLPDEYVVKANHGSGMNLIIRRELQFATGGHYSVLRSLVKNSISKSYARVGVSECETKGSG